MKKFINRILMSSVIALSAAVLFVSCDKEKGGERTPTDLRSDVAGDYPVKISIESLGLELYSTLLIDVEGESDLEGSLSVTAAGIGSISIEVWLSSLSQITTNDYGQVTGYNFKIEEQNISILGENTICNGTGAYDSGYDGIVYKNTENRFFSTEISAMGMTIKIESGEAPEYSAFTGNYYCGVYYDADISEYDITAPFSIVDTGDGNLKINGSFTVSRNSETFVIELILSDLTEYRVANASKSYEGCKFKIQEQNIKMNGADMPFKGTNEYGGADGFLLKCIDGSRMLMFKGEFDTSHSFTVISHELREIFGMYEMEGYVANLDTGDDVSYPGTLVIESDGGEGYVATGTFNITDGGIGEVKVVLKSNEDSLIYMMNSPYYSDDTISKDVYYTANSVEVAFGNYGVVEMQSVGRLLYDYGISDFEFDLNADMEYSLSDFSITDDYIFFGVYGYIAGYGNTMIGFESADIDEENHYRAPSSNRNHERVIEQVRKIFAR